MDDSGIPRSWDDIDDWIRREVEILVAGGCALPPSLAISFVGDRPDLFIETPTYVNENWRVIVSGLIDFFGCVRPERLVVVWPNMFEAEGIRFFAARLNLAEKGPDGRWLWKTRLHPYVLDDEDSRRVAEWGEAFELPRPPDPGSQQLRRMFTAKTYRRLSRRGWFRTPPHDDWDVAIHPESTTFEDFEYLPGVDARDGRLVRAPGERSA